MAFKRWKRSETNKETAKEIAEKYGITGFQALLLQTRGLAGEPEIEAFLYPERLTFDPLTIKDMQKAVERIETALENDQKITVYGDYDADGVTATAILYSYLQTRTDNVNYYIPERNRSGYGLNNESVGALYEQGTQLIVTVDNGISANEQVDLANSLGLDIVVTDHHVPGDILPKACAVVDPHRQDCPSSFKDFAGVGVALMLICALEGEGSFDFILDTYSDLACIGTIADIVPLTGINRAIVKRGIESIRIGERMGVMAIIEAAGIKAEGITSDEVAFKIAPRINALGRLGSSESTVELLLCDSPELAEKLAIEMNTENERRREIETSVSEAVTAQLCAHPEYVSERVIVVYGEGWHGGVIGIAASRLVEKFGKPCIIISSDGETAKGSGRSIAGFSLYNALDFCSDILLGFGGHELAAGLTLKPENVDLFRRKINEYARMYYKTMPVPEIKLACKLNPASVSSELAHQIKILEPFGSGNSVPLFALCEMKITGVDELGSGRHLRLTLSKNGSFVQAMMFFRTRRDFPFDKGDIIDVAVTLDEGEFRGRPTVSVIVRDFRQSGLDQEKIVEGGALFDRFKREEELTEDEVSALLPGRDDLAAVYRAIRSGNGWHGDIYYFSSRVGGSIEYSKMLTCLSVLCSKKLVSIDETGGRTDISLCPVEGKVDIESSEVMMKLKGGTANV
ncbi:MAG: single-stranded-DNA-specific exonuclease RecJ [Clostridia bacterium]|nr:single-stranded-DNA-specific exonuclease RecJ [Clostridia bacterium]